MPVFSVQQYDTHLFSHTHDFLIPGETNFVTNSITKVCFCDVAVAWFGLG